MKQKQLAPVLVNIGFGNVVVGSRIVAVVAADGAPIKRLRDEAKDKNLLVNATEGRRTRSIIITDSGHIIQSALQHETIAQRLLGEKSTEPDPEASK